MTFFTFPTFNMESSRERGGMFAIFSTFALRGCLGLVTGASSAIGIFAMVNGDVSATFTF